MFNAGKARHTVRVEKRSSAQDTAGGVLLSWALVVERKAELQRAPGTEVWAAAGRNQRVPTVFKMRYEQQVLDALTAAETRLLVNGKVHDLVSAFDPDGLKAVMTVTTQEKPEDPA